jgi:peroxiredoxin
MLAGRKAPDFALTANTDDKNAGELRWEGQDHQRRPADTRVCQAQTRRFNEEAPH